MGKIGFAIKKTVEGAREPEYFNQDSWTDKVVDIRHSVLERIRGFESIQTPIRLLSFIEDGAYFVSCRPLLGGRPNDNVTIWVFFPWKIVLTENQLIELLEIVNSSLEGIDNEKLMRLVNYDYPEQLAPIIKMSRGDKLAYRYYTSQNDLLTMLGEGRYQEEYRNYQYVVLLDSNSQITFIDEATDLTSEPLIVPLALLPPTDEFMEKSEISGVEYSLHLSQNGNEVTFRNPIFVNKGESLNIKIKRKGFLPISQQVEAVANEQYCEWPLPLEWKKEFSLKDFAVYDNYGSKIRQVKAFSIWINDIEIGPTPREFSEKECKEAAIKIKADGFIDFSTIRSILENRKFNLERLAVDYNWKIITTKGRIDVSFTSKKHFHEDVCYLEGYRINDNEIVFDREKQKRHYLFWGAIGFFIGLVFSALLIIFYKFGVIRYLINLFLNF